MALLELEKLKKDINTLFGYVRCLMAKSDENCPLVATEWSSNHSTVTGNPYTAGTYVFYNGHVYKCKFNNDGIPPTNTTYWLDLGEGHLLAEEQSDWNATGGRRYIVNKPTNTSDFINDGEDGSSPYVTQDELNNSLPVQDLDSVLAEGDQAPTRGAYIEEIGFWDNFVAPFGFAKINADKSRLNFISKLGNMMFQINEAGWTYVKSPFAFNFNFQTLTNNRIATWQDKSGVVAYLSDIQAATSTEIPFIVVGGTTGTQPTFSGAPLFTGSYVQIGILIHFQIQVDMDNITSFGTGQYYVDLPFASKYGYQFKEGCLHHISNGNQYAIGGHVAAGSNRVYLTYTGSNGQDEVFDHNSPVNLNVADNFHIAGTYIINS